MKQKILIISDIHHRIVEAQKMIDTIPHDKLIFMGDVFDRFGDSLEEIKIVAEWYKKIVNKDNVVALFGNHDLPYAYSSNPHFYCSGFTRQKSEVINKIMERGDWNKVKPFHIEQDWLFSHAGLTLGKLKQLVPSLSPKNYNLNNINAILEREYNGYVERGELNFRYCSLFGCGWDRGGQDKNGGITWCDFSSFAPIRSVKQIFGHSILKNPVIKYYKDNQWGTIKENLYCSKEESARYQYIPIDDIKEYGQVLNIENGCGICLDTNNKHYATLEDGALSIWSI